MTDPWPNWGAEAVGDPTGPDPRAIDANAARLNPSAPPAGPASAGPAPTGSVPGGSTPGNGQPMAAGQPPSRAAGPGQPVSGQPLAGPPEFGPPAGRAPAHPGPLAGNPFAGSPRVESAASPFSAAYPEAFSEAITRMAPITPIPGTAPSRPASATPFDASRGDRAARTSTPPGGQPAQPLPPPGAPGQPIASHQIAGHQAAGHQAASHQSGGRHAAGRHAAAAADSGGREASAPDSAGRFPSGMYFPNTAEPVGGRPATTGPPRPGDVPLPGSGTPFAAQWSVSGAVAPAEPVADNSSISAEPRRAPGGSSSFGPTVTTGQHDLSGVSWTRPNGHDRPSGQAPMPGQPPVAGQPAAAGQPGQPPALGQLPVAGQFPGGQFRADQPSTGASSSASQAHAPGPGQSAPPHLGSAGPVGDRRDTTPVHRVGRQPGEQYESTQVGDGGAAGPKAGPGVAPVAGSAAGPPGGGQGGGGQGGHAGPPPGWSRPPGMPAPSPEMDSSFAATFPPNAAASGALLLPTDLYRPGTPYVAPSVERLATGALLPAAPDTASGGWRKLVFRASGGKVNPGPSGEEVRYRRLIERIRMPLVECHRVAVLSLKGGVGKTTTTVGLGSTLADLRGDRVVAIDANPDRGTLGSKVPRSTHHTVRDLLDARANLRRYVDVRRYLSQAESRLEVLASDNDPETSRAFGEADYRAVDELLQVHFSVLVTDCGTGMLHSAMHAVLELADTLVIVSTSTADGGMSASATLDWLDAHGYGDRVRQAITVISTFPSSDDAVDVDALERHFSSRTRAVVRVPHDPHLATGGHIDLDLMRRGTRDAFLELAAAVSDRFGQERPAAR